MKFFGFFSSFVSNFGLLAKCIFLGFKFRFTAFILLHHLVYLLLSLLDFLLILNDDLFLLVTGFIKLAFEL